MYQNKAPIYDLVSGASIAFAALLLLVPGFFTDLIGFLLLIPFSRRMIIKLFLSKEKTEEKTQKNKTIDGEIVNKDKDEL